MHTGKLYNVLCGLVIVSVLCVTAGCSKKEEQPQSGEKGRIEKMTDEAAKTAVEKIRTPQDKARATQGLGDERVQEIDKAMQKQ